MREQTSVRVQELIAEIIARRILEAENIHPAYGRLWRAIETTALAGGKRMRPYLTMLGYGEYDERVVPVAVAQELLHIAMLVHDDIIDEDTVRHGKVNITGEYLETYRPHLSQSQVRHFADSAALLAGDALISEAYQCITRSELPLPVISLLHKQLGQAIFEVIGGELLDVEAGFIQDTPYDPFAIYYYKTASYSVIGPLLAGAIAAEANQQTLDTFSAFGATAGIAFQLQDDLLGLYGDPDLTGKSIVSDLREAKATYLVDEHRKHADQPMMERFERLFGNQEVSDEELEALKDDMRDSGAKQTVEQLIRSKYEEAITTLHTLPESPQRHEITQLTQKLMSRTQ